MAAIPSPPHPRSIRRIPWSEHAGCDLSLLTRPVVFTGAIADWDAAAWTPQSLAASYGDAPVSARFHMAEGAPTDDETDGLELEVELRAFCVWLDARASAELPPPLDALPAGCVGYVTYERFAQMFALHPRALTALDWRALGADVDSSESTFWLGSRGARTPCHQDAYGANLVAQLYGSKRWRLFPPGSARVMRPSRVPYEESSVFARASAAELAAVAGRLELELRPGELLLVPKHWWHEVETTSAASVSVNAWLALRDDPRDRAREALVRLVASALLTHGAIAPHGEEDAIEGAHRPWLNPRESIWPVDESIGALTAALAEDAALSGGGAASSGRALEMADVVDALCTGAALDAALGALHAARSRPSHA
jgi:HSPB1-associated protein 1